MVIILRITATSATFGNLPAAFRRSWKTLSTGFQLLALIAESLPMRRRERRRSSASSSSLEAFSAAIFSALSWRREAARPQSTRYKAATSYMWRRNFKE